MIPAMTQHAVLVTVQCASVLAVSAALCFSSVHAQNTESAPTVEDRLAALERQVASLDTRLGLLATARPDRGVGPNEGLATVTRLEQLERQLDRLTADLRRIERQSDTALREAGQARREATEAQRLARAVENRTR